MNEARINELKAQIAELKSRWPAHSVPPAMMEQLDDLEDALRIALEKSGESIPKTAFGAQEIVFRPIGYVENGIHEIVSPDRIREVDSRLVIDPSLVEGLKGLEVGQQVMVIFYFHRSEGFDLLQHPQGDRSRPQRGVFALHSPRRPNPIGVTAVQLIGIEGPVLRVRGLDAIHGTPILDLKPMHESFQTHPEA